MKRLVAFALILCLLLGLAACTKPVPQNPTIPSTSTTVPTTTPTTAPTANPKPFAGKTLQILGNGNAESFTDYEKFGKGSYLWMMRAAMDEWAAMNGVTIKYAGSFNSNSQRPDLTPDDKPDILFQTNYFPTVANCEMVSPWTEAEYNTLAQITGDRRYLDMLEYRTKSYGVVLPWGDNTMLYFNQSMFARYNVKSPLEYWTEGNWTWDAFEACLKAMTRDTDNDGTVDTYGINAASWSNLLNPLKMSEKGEIVNNIDDPWFLDYFALKYNSYAVDFTTTTGRSKIKTTVSSPMVAMEMSDCAVYDYEQVYSVLSNGDQIMAVPLPKWTGEGGESQEWLKWMQTCAHLYADTDEREAAFDLICYMLKCGMKYMSDMSMGAVKCDYAGILGTSELSAKWKTAFAKVLEDRKTGLANLPHYDAAHIAQLSDYLAKIDTWHAYSTFGGIQSLLNSPEIIKMPPETAFPTVKEKYQQAIDKYNELYIYNQD